MVLQAFLHLLIIKKYKLYLRNTGVFNATLVTVNEEIRPNNNIAYTSLASDDPKVIKIQLSNMSFLGNYTFTLSKNFVMDNFRNYSIERTITISNTSGADLELPGPYTQLLSPPVILVRFTWNLPIDWIWLLHRM